MASIVALVIPLLSPAPVHAALTSHAPISINGNSGFTSPDPVNGGGSGTASDPYIIENWDIITSSATGISISNTTAYFVIRRCYVHDGGYYGIYLYNVTNGVLDNVLAKNNSFGFVIMDSDNNIIKNCILENNGSCGIYSSNSNNNIYYNDTCGNNWSGIYITYYSSNNLVENCTTEYNDFYGVKLEGHSDNNLVENCDMSNNDNYGIQLLSSDNNCISNNFLENNYWSGICLLNDSNNNTISNNTCSNNVDAGNGIDLYENSDNNTISGNTCSNNYYFGIRLRDSSNNTISNNITENTRNIHGIFLESSDNNLIENNTVRNNQQCGIQIYLSSNNTISNNIVEDTRTYEGILIQNSGNNLVFNNLVRNNPQGIGLYISSNNHIYHNNFVNNTAQAYDGGSNFWDDSYPSGGNYWSDYTGTDYYSGENQNIPGGDGIGDAPYNISGGSNRDHYPLMNHWPIAEGTATFKLENLYKVSLEKDLQLYTGSLLLVWFYKYDNTFQAVSLIESITPPQSVEENENVPHPRAEERFSWGSVQIATLTLADNTGNVISTIASFTVHPSDLRNRYMAILADWGNHPEQQSAFRAEVMDILSQWSSAPP